MGTIKKENLIMNNKGIVGIIDGDILIYRACHKALKENKDVTSVFDDLYDDLIEQMACTKYSLHISGSGNFRKKLRQGFTKYKGKRKEKPANYYFLRDYILKNYDVVTAATYEADDTASIEASGYLKTGQWFMLGTVDKDWIMIGGMFYNMQYQSLKVYSPIEAAAHFHKQLITGDSVDNIPGIRGMGPKKAEKLLAGKNLKEQFDAIIETYKEHFPEDYMDRLTTMGILLYLVKDYDDPMWNVDFWKEYLNGLNESAKV